MTGATSLERDVPRRVVAVLRTALGNRLLSIVLFGSRARGDYRPESDWDLLIIAEGLPEKLFDRHLFISRLLPLSPGGGISGLAKTPEEFESHLPSLYLDIALDGRILYDPCGYAAKHLATIREMIEEAGLNRERTEAGDIWRWKKEPPGRWGLGVGKGR